MRTYLFCSEQVIQGLHEQINLYEQDIEMLKEQVKGYYCYS